jgi:hypothetical protein
MQSYFCRNIFSFKGNGYVLQASAFKTSAEERVSGIPEEMEGAVKSSMKTQERLYQMS